MFKKTLLIICLTICLLCPVAFGEQQQITFSNVSNDNTLTLILRERLSFLGDTYAFNKGATIDNVTDGAITFAETSEDLIWTFTSDVLTVTSSTSLLRIDYGAIVLKGDQFFFKPVSSAVGDDEGTVYYDSGENKLRYRSTGSWVSLPGSAAAGGSDTQIQYNSSNVLAGITNVIWDGTNFEFANDQSIAFGTAAEWTLNYDNSVAQQLLWETNNTSAAAITDPMFEILIQADTVNGTGITADQEVFGISKGTQASNVSLLTLDVDGDLTLNGTFYQADIAAAASGITNLTINAGLAGSGTITFGNSSTGKAIFVRETDFNDKVTLGDAADDDVTITGDIVANVTFDDDTGDSPSLIFRDAGENDWIILKADGSGNNLTVTSDTGTSDFQIVTGNLKVGSGSEGLTLDGDDAYVTGTFEVDGATQLDNTLTVSGNITTNGNLTATLGASEYYKLDGDTSANTTTAGVLDMDVRSLTASNKAIYIDYELDDGSSGTHYGIYIDLDDDAAGGDETFHALSVLNSAGVNATSIGLNVANTINTGVNIISGAASVAIAIDAAATEHTGAAGVVDIEFDSKTADSEAVNIKVTHLTGGSGQSISGMEIELKNDSGNSNDIMYGLIINVTDSTATGTEKGIYIKGAGIDAGIQLDTGYIRIGTGSSPDIAPGDDDLYVEGTIEVDGAARFDGSITGDGEDALGGFLYTVTDDIDDEVLVASDSGGVFTNQGDANTQVYTLPDAAIGLWFIFADVETAGTADLCILAASGDTINGGSAAQYYNCYNDAVGDSVILVAISVTEWVVISKVGTWTNDSDTTSP